MVTESPSTRTFYERPRQDVLEGRRVQQITDFFLGHSLLGHQAKQNGVPHFSEVVEELGLRVRVLDDVGQLGAVVTQDSWKSQ